MTADATGETGIEIFPNLVEDEVIISFTDLVRWVALDKHNALELAGKIIECVDALERVRMGSVVN